MVVVFWFGEVKNRCRLVVCCLANKSQYAKSIAENTQEGNVVCRSVAHWPANWRRASMRSGSEWFALPSSFVASTTASTQLSIIAIFTGNILARHGLAVTGVAALVRHAANDSLEASMLFERVAVLKAERNRNVSNVKLHWRFCLAKELPSQALSRIWRPDTGQHHV